VTRAGTVCFIEGILDLLKSCCDIDILSFPPECRESHLTFTCNDCKRRRRLRIKSKKRKEMTQDMILTSLEAPKTNTLLSQIEKES
jgi:hypothetical protein